MNKQKSDLLKIGVGLGLIGLAILIFGKKLDYEPIPDDETVTPTPVTQYYFAMSSPLTGAFPRSGYYPAMSRLPLYGGVEETNYVFDHWVINGAYFYEPVITIVLDKNTTVEYFRRVETESGAPPYVLPGQITLPGNSSYAMMTSYMRRRISVTLTRPLVASTGTWLVYDSTRKPAGLMMLSDPSVGGWWFAFANDFSTYNQNIYDSEGNIVMSTIYYPPEFQTYPGQ